MDDGADDDIPLPTVRKAIMEKIAAFCGHMRTNPPPEIEKPLKSSNFIDITTPWYADFVDLSQDMLFDLIMAANYLDIKALLDLACAKVASQIKSKSVKEIRQFFNIENDFTPEEEQQIMEENKWAEESF